MAFTRTLPVAATPVEPRAEPEPSPAVAPAIALAPPGEPALAETPLLRDSAGGPAETPTEPLGILEGPAMRRRFRMSTLLGIVAGAALGLGAAAYFSRAATPVTATVPAAAEPVALAAAREVAPATSPAPATPLILAATPASTDDAPVAMTPKPGSAPSCQELLGSAHVEKRDPAAAYEQTQLGQRELVRGDVTGAQQAFCKAASWDENNVERWLNLSQIFLIRRDGAKAADCARAALELHATNPRALTVLGDASAMLGKTAEARQAYIAAENASEPDRAALQLMIRRDMEEALRLLKRRDFVRAERLFRRVMIFDAGHAGANAGLTTCLAKLQNDP